MFILRKIVGSRTNVPEPILVPCDMDFYYQEGCLCYMYGNFLMPAPEDDETKVKYIALETKHTVEESEPLKCYRVTDNMIFETTVAEGSDFYIGATIGPELNPKTNVIDTVGLKLQNPIGRIIEIIDIEKRKVLIELYS